MNRNGSKLSGVLHLLSRMAEHARPITAEMLGRIMPTNPVVIRRVIAGLREAGYVRSVNVTLLDIYRAIGAPPLFTGSKTHDHA